MLVDMMKSAFGVPPSLPASGLRGIEPTIASNLRNAVDGDGCAACVVTKGDVEALRSALHAAATGSVSYVTREEAGVLFEIARATANGTCDPAFDDLFARAVGNYLMATCWHGPSRNQVLHRKYWLDKRATFLLFLPVSGQGESCRESMKPALNSEKESMAALQYPGDAARTESGQIAATEVDWVVAHLTRQGSLTSAETRLLEWLGDEVNALPPKLRAVIESVNDIRAWLLMNDSLLQGIDQSRRSPQPAHQSVSQ
jgi:hypothetical protein